MIYEHDPVLKQMIDNNKPHWKPETIKVAHKKLEDYEQKSAAFDEILKSFDESISKSHMADDVIDIVNGYRGESDD